MMMRTKNFDRYTNDVARMRQSERQGAQKPAKPAKDETPVQEQPIQPIQPAQPIAQKPDWVNVLVEAARGDGGQITMFPCDLAPLLGLPAGKDLAAILGVLETERHSLFSAGVYYFPRGMSVRAAKHSAITFRELELDSRGGKRQA